MPIPSTRSSQECDSFTLAPNAGHQIGAQILKVIGGSLYWSLILKVQGGLNIPQSRRHLPERDFGILESFAALSRCVVSPLRIGHNVVHRLARIVGLSAAIQIRC